MLSQFSLAQLACRASNLAEQLFLLRHLSPPHKHQPLTRGDLLVNQQDLELLFPVTDSAHDSFYHLKRRAIGRALRLFRWYELNLAALSAEQHQVFLEVHSPWIGTYERAAIAYSSTCSRTNVTAIGSHASRSAVSAPFLQLIEVELRRIFDGLAPQGLVVPSYPRLIEAVQQFYRQRIAIMTAQFGQSFEQNIASGEDRIEACHAFYLRQPVLCRWLAQVCADLIQFVSLALTRLCEHRHELAQQLWNDELPRQVTQLKLRQDTIQGQWTACFSLQMASGQEQQICYYPFALEAERALQTLWTQIDKGISSAADPGAVLCFKGYGYIRTRTSAQEALANKKSPEALRQLGQRAAVQRLLGHQGLWSQIQIGLWSSETVPTPAEEHFRAGLESVQRWCLNWPSIAIQTLKDFFKETSVQLCHRSPAAYLLLLVTAQQRFLLTNPLAIDAIFRILVKQPCAWDKAGEIAQLEVKMLWQFKAPCLRVLMDRRYMIYGPDHVMFTKLPTTPLEFLACRIQQRTSLQPADATQEQLLSATP